MKKEKRIQEGVMHVYFRANGRYTVFYDDEDNLELLRRIDKFANYNPVLLARIVPQKSVWETCTMERLAKEVNKMLSGRMLNNLSKVEIADLIVEVKNRTNCKMMQLASILHVDYKFVKNCFQRAVQGDLENGSEMPMRERKAPQPE